MKKRLPFLIVLIVLAGIFLAIIQNQRTIKDYYIVATTDLPGNSLELKTNLSLTGRGSFLYEASQTEIDGREAFNQACSSVLKEHSIVLGCYGNQRIFIFDVDDPKLAGIKEVTAAHELLHAAYERLSSSQRLEVNNLLLQQWAKIIDQEVLKVISQYQKEADDIFVNELHSIIGTEVSQVSPELETHYKQYFNDRGKIVSYSEAYKKVFRDNEAAIASFDVQLASKKSQIDSLETSLGLQRQNLQASSNQLESLRNSNPGAYNNAVPGYNQQVAQYNASVASLKQQITEYNQLVVQRNAAATAQNDLAQSLDSNQQPLQWYT